MLTKSVLLLYYTFCLLSLLLIKSFINDITIDVSCFDNPIVKAQKIVITKDSIIVIANPHKESVIWRETKYSIDVDIIAVTNVLKNWFLKKQ